MYRTNRYIFDTLPVFGTYAYDAAKGQVTARVKGLTSVSTQNPRIRVDGDTGICRLHFKGLNSSRCTLYEWSRTPYTSHRNGSPR